MADFVEDGEKQDDSHNDVEWIFVVDSSFEKPHQRQAERYKRKQRCDNQYHVR